MRKILTEEAIGKIPNLFGNWGDADPEALIKLLLDDIKERQRLRKADAERAFFMLSLQEWQLDTDGKSLCCPQCDNFKEDGHAVDCGYKDDFKYFKAIAKGE